jgi:ABC-type uncharacterized transport system ATPase subunit
MSLIQVHDLNRHFRVLNRREGLIGAVRDMFSADYRSVRAVDGVSFDIEPGEIVGYIGPNGAGKSTTIKMMTGILKPTDSHLLVDGNKPYENRKRNAQDMGVVFGQRTQLWWDLPVIESLKILKEIYRVSDEVYDRQMALFSDLADIRPLYHTQVRKLSLGQRMLCDIVAPFLHNPKIVFLDEPTIGLDVSIKAKIRTVIKELDATHNATIILTTHDLGDVEALCQRIIIIDKGKITFDGPINQVNEMFGAYRTLKVQIFGFKDGTMDQIRTKTDERFSGVPITVENTEPGWTDITVNQDEVPLLEVLNHVMEALPCTTSASSRYRWRTWSKRSMMEHPDEVVSGPHKGCFLCHHHLSLWFLLYLHRQLDLYGAGLFGARQLHLCHVRDMDRVVYGPDDQRRLHCHGTDQADRLSDLYAVSHSWLRVGQPGRDHAPPRACALPGIWGTHRDWHRPGVRPRGTPARVSDQFHLRLYRGHQRVLHRIDMGYQHDQRDHHHASIGSSGTPAVLSRRYPARAGAAALSGHLPTTCR